MSLEDKYSYETPTRKLARHSAKKKAEDCKSVDAGHARA